MNPSAIKDLLLNVWTRFGVSWVAKLLTVWLGYDAATSDSTAKQVVAGVSALAIVAFDAWGHFGSHKKALDTPAGK